MNRRVLVLFAALILFASVGGALLYLVLNGSVIPRVGISTPTPGATEKVPGHAGNGCGVKKNNDGTYHFSWLHVSSDGKIVDESNCIVNLVGLNMGALFVGDAGVGQFGVQANPIKIAYYKKTFGINLVRTNFNSLWWDDDVFVPLANMHFRQWLQQYVKWQEQNGNYIELDEGPHFPEPPCGGAVSMCPSQDQGKKDYQANPNPISAQELETNITPGVQAWSDLAKIYANDPAVIYDALNEPTIKNLPEYFQDMNTIINTIRAQNPRSLIVVYDRGWKDIAAGSYPDYTQPDLVLDAHIYDGFKGTSPATGQKCNEPGRSDWTPANSGFDNLVAFAHSHGKAYIINEWGGCYNLPNYNQQIVSFAKANDIALTYFQPGDLVTINATNGSQQFQLNDNGRILQTDYVSIIG